MVTPKGLSANLQHLDVKTNSLRKAILMLALRWKDLDEHLDSAKICFGESLANLELKQKDLDCNRELDSVRESLKLQLDDLECEKEKFRNFQQNQIENFNMKEEQMSAILRGIEERLEEVGSREERLHDQKKAMEELLRKIEMEKNEFVEIQQSVGEKLNAIISKERSFEGRCEELEKRGKELDLREEQIKAIQHLNKQRVDELNIKVQELDAAQKLIEEQAEKLPSRKEKNNSVSKKRRADTSQSQTPPPFLATKLTITPVTHIASFPEASSSSLSTSHRQHKRWKRNRMLRSAETAADHPASLSKPCPAPYLPATELIITPVTHAAASPEASSSSLSASHDRRKRWERNRMRRNVKTGADHPSSLSKLCPVSYLPPHLLVLSDNDESN